MPTRVAALLPPLFLAAAAYIVTAQEEKPAPTLSVTWYQNILTVSGDGVPGNELKVWYLEAYCRAGSTDQDWADTVVGHTTKLLSTSDDGSVIRLRCTLNDGVIVDHTITAGSDEITFDLKANNPTEKVSEAHWAQPCVRVGKFTGTGAKESDDPYAYIKKSFIYLDQKRSFMPTPEWATRARYEPGQVWCPKLVPRTDVNPRPLSEAIPSNGLIGCVSADGKTVFATAWEPYQELFQGVIRCLHSDFRIGGLEPGETKNIRGKIYLVPNDEDALLDRYKKDFPEHFRP